MMSAAARNACAVASVVLLLAACQPSEPQLEPAAGSEAAAPATAAVPAHAAGEVVFDLPFTDDSIRTLSGTKQADGLVATEQAGVLAFGPYRAFEAGHYQLVVDGTTENPIVVEVVSAKGAKTHAKQQIVAVAAGAPLATVPFDLDQPVPDLEIRLLTPTGSGARLLGYRVLYR